MAAASDALEQAILELIYQSDVTGQPWTAFGTTAGATSTDIYVALHSAYVTDAGAQNLNELAYTGYARVAVTRNGTGGWTVGALAPGFQVTNTATTLFGTKTDAGSVEARYLTTGVASSGATAVINRTHIGDAPEQFSVPATGTTVNVPSHSLVNDDEVVLYETQGGSMPSGFSDGTEYFIVNSVAGVSVELSATQGGAAINSGSIGDGWIAKLSPLTIAQSSAPQFLAGDIDFRIA